MRRVLLLLLLPALWLPGCGLDGGDSPSPARTLVRGNGGDPGTLDPHLADDIHAFNVLVDLYEGLVAESANGELIPGVARDWTVTDDGRTYTFRLRPDARWSNGDRVIAQDFVRSLDRATAPDTNAPYAFLFHGRDVEALALSDHELKIGLSGHWNELLSVLSMPIAFPAHASGDPAISNGAYSLVSREPGGKILLQKNEHYWDADAVSIDSVAYLPISDAVAEFNMYRSGELDVTHSIPSEMLQSAVADYGGEARLAPSLALYYIAFDLTEPPFDDPLLRQALSVAVSREDITSLLGRGERPAYGIVPPGVAGYAGAIYEWHDAAQDERIARARKLFAEAGYSPDAALEVRLLYDAGDVHERIALAVSATWRDVLGVDVSLEKREWKYFLDSRDQRGDWDLMRFAWFGDYNSPSTFLDIFRSDSDQNLARYASTTYDELLLEASRASPPESAAAMRRAEEHLLADYPVIPVYFFANKHMVKPYVLGFEDNVTDRHPTRFLAIGERP